LLRDWEVSKEKNMRASTVLLALPLTLALLAPVSAQEVRTGSEAFGTWEDDAPGVSRHIKPADLPPPSHHQNDPEEPDFKLMPKVVEAPQGETPDVPNGFTVQAFAKGLKKPRVIRIAPNGDIFVAESEGGRVLVFPAAAAKSGTATPEVFAEKLERPFGIAFHPPGDKPQHVYVAAANQVVRYPYSSGDRKATGPAEVIIADIPTKRHWTRDLEVSRDGSRLFVSIGSASNVAGTMPEKTPDEIKAYEKAHGLGAAWGEEENRAVVRVFDPEGKTVRNYATGLRNCSGMAMQPGTDTLWCTGNERDHIGPELAPDYLTTVKEGGFYGWPWYYIGGNEDPAHAGKRPDLKDKVSVPDVLLQAHSSTLDLVFYDKEAFPAEYRGDAFATMHGSWNREGRTGYKVIRARMKDGKPTGVYEDFMTGFVLDKDTVWGRPAGIAVTQDGALLVSDDANGTIYQVTYDPTQ
jgi:glucose/arabinose dehydrogenase